MKITVYYQACSNDLPNFRIDFDTSHFFKISLHCRPRCLTKLYNDCCTLTALPENTCWLQQLSWLYSFIRINYSPINRDGDELHIPPRNLLRNYFLQIFKHFFIGIFTIVNFSTYLQVAAVGLKILDLI